MYRLIDHKQNILRPKGDQSFHTVCANNGPSRRKSEILLGGTFSLTNLPFDVGRINSETMPSDN